MFPAEEDTILPDALIIGECGVLPYAVVGIRGAEERAFMRQGLRDALIPHRSEPGEDRLYLAEGSCDLFF
jgi:hypothetical protein